MAAVTSSTITATSPALFSSPSLRPSFIFRHLQRNPKGSNLNQHILSHKHKKPSLIIAGVSTAGTESGVGDSELVLEVREIKERSKKWLWKGQYSINYFVQAPAEDSGRPPLVLVHGFGASIPHWRRMLGAYNSFSMIIEDDEMALRSGICNCYF